MSASRPIVAALLLLGLAFPAGAAYIDHFTVPDDIGQNKIPRAGTRPILVVRVEIGSSADWSQTEDFFDRLGPADNFTRYWLVNSLGTYQPIAVLPPPIFYDTCPMPPPHDDCVIDRGDITALVPAMTWLADVFARLDAEAGIDLGDFDSNGDGWADGVIVISTTEVGGIALPVAELAQLFPALFDPGDFTFDGVKLNGVAVAERRDFRNYLHEFGHVLGFDDMYNEGTFDVTNPDTGLERNPGSAHSLMGSGYSQHTMLNALDRVRAGWATVVEVRSVQDAIRIPPVTETGVVYKIGSGDEYFLVENRRPPVPGDLWYPFDDDLPGDGGLAIYRVSESKTPDPDFGIIARMIECPNCNEFEPFIFFEQADGEFAYQSTDGFDEQEDPDDFFATGDAFLPVPENTAPLSRSNLVLRSNLLSGAVTGAAVHTIDAEAAAPDVIATLEPFGAPTGCGTVGGAAPSAGMVANASRGRVAEQPR